MGTKEGNTRQILLCFWATLPPQRNGQHRGAHGKNRTTGPATSNAGAATIVTRRYERSPTSGSAFCFAIGRIANRITNRRTWRPFVDTGRRSQRIMLDSATQMSMPPAPRAAWISDGPRRLPSQAAGLLPTPYSLFPIPYSLLPTPYFVGTRALSSSNQCRTTTMLAGVAFDDRSARCP